VVLDNHAEVAAPTLYALISGGILVFNELLPPAPLDKAFEGTVNVLGSVSEELI